MHFEITADDGARAAEFYRNTFGWSVTKWDGPRRLLAGEHGRGPRHRRRHHGPGDQPVINTVQVEGTVEDAVARVEKAGGTQVGDINTIPGVGRFTYAGTPRATSSASCSPTDPRLDCVDAAAE